MSFGTSQTSLVRFDLVHNLYLRQIEEGCSEERDGFEAGFPGWRCVLNDN
jgi:hypothetical protein